jgi:S-disulfanyl-L-cysteine oxidoreductase SoxD
MRNACIGLILLFLVGLLSTNSAQQTQSLWTGVYTDTQAERGAAVFKERCASCHATDLRGNSNTPSLLGVSFMFLWEGRSLGELYSKMRSEMPSDQPGSLPAQNYLDILAFILRANQFPAGEEELKPEQSDLEKILISPDGAIIKELP